MDGPVPDRRLTPANGRVAAARLVGQVVAERFTEGEARSVAVPVADLLAAPDGRRERQLLLGEGVTLYEDRGGHAFVEADRDGYVGYVRSAALGPAVAATHVVSVPASHLYPAPDIKRTETHRLSFGSRLRIVGGADAFYETDAGLYVPRQHLRPANRPFTDPATVAQLFFGTPYLWGGNTIWGIDCSGLVQAAHLACGHACPGDSDLQAAALGALLPDGTPLARGDLLFWKGHVAMAVDPDTIIHATGAFMSVVYEPAAEAIARIEAAEGNRVLAHRRLGRGAPAGDPAPRLPRPADPRGR